MGRVKQLSIESELPDVGSMYPATRVYIMNGSCLTREEFISQVALSLYVNEPQTNIRETIDLLLEDDMKELVCSGGDKFFSYITHGETKHSRQYDFDGDIVEKDMEEEERPLKSYEVSYDVFVQALIKGITKKRVYKRVTEAIAATSFREAKELIRKRTHAEGKTTKSYEVVEVKLTETKEVRDPSNAE